VCVSGRLALGVIKLVKEEVHVSDSLHIDVAAGRSCPFGLGIGQVV
jgi:hypothetical protein